MILLIKCWQETGFTRYRETSFGKSGRHTTHTKVYVGRCSTEQGTQQRMIDRAPETRDDFYYSSPLLRC